MKKLVAIILPLMVLLALSCNKPVINDPNVVPIKFEFQDTMAMTLPPALGLGLPISLPIPSIGLSFNDTVGGINPLVALVEDIHIKDMTLQLNSPGLTWDFLKNIAIYIETPEHGSIEMAHRFSIPNGLGTTMVLEPATENRLDNWVKADDFSISTEVTIDEFLDEEVDIQIFLNLDVTLINE